MTNYSTKVYLKNECEETCNIGNYAEVGSYTIGIKKRYKDVKLFIAVSDRRNINVVETFPLYICDEASIKLIKNKCKINGDLISRFIEITEDEKKNIAIVKKARRTFKFQRTFK